ncbi:MAG: LacI family DNA-binding transcriptional regulator [Bythopirellula sp.]|nr:LacI family DNA-binding transcriptional regulator [Bythopirellula sp.]
MPSIREVAKEAGVSIATVSRVINGNGSVALDLKNQVLAAIDRCDYLPSVGRRTCDSVALVYAGQFSPGSPYDSACIEGMINVMRKSGHDLVVIDLVRDKLPDENYRQFFARKGICGAIVRSTASDREVLTKMALEPFPLVVLGDHFEHPTLPFVYASSRNASREAMEHLISLGHRNIAFAASDCEDGDHGDRFAAYCDVMKTAGLFKEEVISRIPPHRMDGAQLLRKLMAMPNPPTGVFAADPFIAIGLINEAHSLGIKVPSELSIVGFDDTDTRSLLYPRMTAICQDSFLLGSVAFECVVQLIKGDSHLVKASYVQTAWLEINSTTAPPPAERFRVLTNGLRLPTLGKVE